MTDMKSLEIENSSGESANIREDSFFNTYVQDLCASFVISFRIAFTVDTILGLVLSVGYTLLYWCYGTYLAVNMNLTIISIAVVFPISQGISMAFKRRETALQLFGDMLGNLLSIYGAIYAWRIKEPSTGKWVTMVNVYSDAEVKKEKLHSCYSEFFQELVLYFTTPRGGRARYAVACCGGQKEASMISSRLMVERANADAFFGRLQSFIQDLKERGLPGGEAHRLDSYLSKSVIAWEKLIFFKEYRTPQAFRSFARVYVLVIGALYGPNYLQIARGNNDDGDFENIGLAIAYATGFQLAISGLLAVMLGLEDPFYRDFGRGKMDSVNVKEIAESSMKRLAQIRKTSSDNASIWKDEDKAEWQNLENR